MRTYFVLPLALMTFAVTSVDAVAVTRLTEEQVRTVCGKQLGPVIGGSFGCTKKCGDKMCDYSCNKDQSGKGTDCMGFVVIRTPGGKVGKGVLSSDGILGSGPVLGTQTPGAVGSPLGGGAAPAGPSLR